MNNLRNIQRVSIALTATLLLSCSFSQKQSSLLYHQALTTSYDVIVVPGVPFENGEWSPTMKARVLWSKHLFDIGIAKNIMYSGSAVYSPYVEAEIMAAYAEELGIPSTNILTETQAEHSTENVYYSYKKAKKLGFTTVALASDPFQTKMLKSMIKKRLKNDVGLIPIVFDTLSAMEERQLSIKIDYESLYQKDFKSIVERENFRQRFRGTRGKNLDFSIFE